MCEVSLIKIRRVVNMWKVLLLMATVANTIYIVSSVDTYTDSEQDCVEYASDSNESCGGEPYNQCPKNERWVQCPSGLCQPRNCTELGYPVPCPIQSVDGRCSTEPGCICIEGYLRNKYGVCIPKKQCPSCGGDPNAEATCRCDKLCSGQIKPCPKICNPNSCNCREGYVRDENSNKCVLPKDCTQTCGRDEVFDGCVNGGCHTGRTCEEADRLNGNEICVRPKICLPGCLCKPGYVRNNKGVCVPRNQCPRKCPVNERWDRCPAWLCQHQKCTELGSPVACPGVTVDGKCPGRPDCVCIDGYLRNERGICVPEHECPLKCGPNEELNSCANGGCHSGRVCDDLDRLNGSTICIDPIKCEPGCLCKPGYLRNRQGVCVLENRCPNSKCKLDHETYSNCPAWRCDPQSCTELGFPIACPNLLPAECPGKPGCICAQGYVRNNKGICIPVNECPSCGGDPNAVSGCGMACVKKCSNYWRNDIACILSCQLNGCSCRDGYVYDENIGKCVKYWECTPVCGQNEEYSDCTNGGCYGARDCTDDLNTPVKCVKIDPKYCKRGCVCKKGYLRNNNGVCVAIEECPVNEQCKGRNTFYDACPPSCASETCESIGKIIDCPPHAPVCRPRCRCAQGYYYDKNGECISDKDCPRPCPENEYWSGCANGGCYGPRNCSQITGPSSIRPVICVDLIQGACLGGCLCKDKLLRNDQGVCVPEDKCPRICGPNEEFDVCPGRCPARKCGIDDRKIFCPKQPNPGDKDCPPPACRCKSGFYRNDKGVCVTWNQCPPPRNETCKANEVYDECPAKCPPRVCGIDDRLIDCAPQPVKGDPNCPRPACRCRNGYYRNPAGNCVKWEDCPQCNNPNEIYDPCPAPCPPQRCDVNPAVILCMVPPKVGDPECKPGCRCTDGHVRNDKGICIPRDQCPKCNRPNEEWNPCPDTCPPQTCESIGQRYNCPNKPVDNPNCQGQCVCREGYYRNKLGDCISKDDCLRCTGPHEYYSCGGACDNKCSNYGDQNQDNCPIINIKCNEMCYCERGYARDNNGTCVPLESCRRCKGAHEYYDEFAPPNLNEYCATAGSSPRLVVDESKPRYKPTCRCEDGYLRDSNGNCIPEQKCPCYGNATWSSCGGNNCGRSCSDLNRTDPVNCVLMCFRGCECNEGYYYDINTKSCVLPKDCPQSPPQCPNPNEVYHPCPSTCPGQRCDVDPRVIRCAAPPQIGDPRCEPSCICKSDYRRDANGRCIPKEDCPCGGDPNATSSGCGSNCGRMCSDLNRTDPVICPLSCRLGGCECRKGYYFNNITQRCVLPEDCNQCKDPNAVYGCGNNCGRHCSDYNKEVMCTMDCPGGCECKKGYVLDDNTGKCVPPERCTPICNGPNEHYSCGGACDNVCATLSKQNQTHCPIINIRCNDKCYCNEGYCRDKNNICVPIKPDRACKDPNAVWSECGNDNCGRTCSSLNATDPVACIALCRVGSCECREGYYYDNNTGKCVLPKDCTSCGGDPNASWSDCGDNNCGRTCADLNRTDPVACLDMCYNGCQCKKGYYYNNVTKRCVLPEDCKICPLNERYSTCLQAECRALTCEDRGKSIACPRIRPEYCKKGCVCEEGYLRNKQGRCIPVKDCPCPGNLIWNECPGDCDADYCPRTRDDLQSCLTRNCGEQRCTCGFDQKRDRKTGNCIRTSDCPPFPCDGPNEEFQACPPLCPGDKCSDINRNCSALGHIGIVVPCRLECRCKKNYWRNSKGICVCADECREDGNNNGNNSNSSEELTKGIHDFSFDFMRTLLKTSKGKSTIASPYSVLLALAQLVLYSTGESQRQLLGALNLQNNDQVRQAFTQLTRTMRSSSDVQFAQAVKVFVNDEYRLTRAFQDDTRNVFNGTAENIDCNQPEQTANYINKWVEDQTNNKIKNLISKDVINKLLRLILVNAIYFKGKWLTQFNKNDTKDRDFYLNKDTKIQVPTMYLESRLNYAYDENLKAHFLELPYVGKEFKMVICLPSDIEGLQDTLSKLTAATMQQALNRMTTQKVRVFLPSFKVETSLDLNDLLKAIGISDIFSPEKAGLRNIVENNDQLYVSKVVHKAFIETTEEGTEAAAATAVVVKTLSLQLPIEVIANHPFLYLIMKNKNIIFTGDYNGK